MEDWSKIWDHQENGERLEVRYHENEQTRKATIASNVIHLVDVVSVLTGQVANITVLGCSARAE